MRKRFNKLFSQAIIVFMVIFSCFPGQAGAAFLTGGNVPNQFSNNGTAIVYTSGNMGIGTTVPGYALDVQGGQMNASGGLCIAGSCKTAWTQITGSNFWGGTMDSNIWNGTSGAGNVGIGLTNPNYKLDVSGQGRFIGSTAAAPALRLGTGTGGIMSSGTNDVALVSNGINVATFVASTAIDVRFQINTTNYSTMFGQYEGTWFGTTNPMIMQPLSPATAHDIVITGTQNTPTNGIVIKAAGNIGIGTTNPSAAKLQITGGGIDANGSINGTSLCIGGTCKASWDAAGNLWSGTRNGAIWNGDTGTGNVGIGTTGPNANLQISNSSTVATTFDLTNTSAGGTDWNWNSLGSGVTGRIGDLSLDVKGVRTVMEITSAGNVGIGMTNPTTKLYVSGDVTAAAYYYSSDRTLKTNIKTLNNSLEKILKLRGVSFDWKKDGKESMGLIAQEVKQVYPELVGGTAGNLSIQYGNLVAPLIEAIKEQQGKINTLEARIKILEKKK